MIKPNVYICGDVCFNGGSDEHEVKEITDGIRDVLIVWFSKKQSKFSLI
jgi:hypothetical protein